MISASGTDTIPVSRARDGEAAPRDQVAHWPQPVAVGSGYHPAAVGGNDGRRAIPWLHDGIRVAVQVAPVIGHGGCLLGPCLRDQQGLGHRRVAAGPHEKFEYRVQRSRVGGARGNHRLDVFGAIAEALVGEADLVRAHPVGVAAERVDFAVVGERAERLCEPPLREGVGGIALVEEDAARLEAFILQVGIKGGNLLGQHHSLVDPTDLQESEHT